MNRLRGIVTIIVTATCGLGWAAALPASAAAETTPPTITITSPTEGQFYALNAPITPAFSCADPGGSGVAFCGRTGPAASTSTAGAHTFTVLAVDNDGNTTSKTVNYFVDATPPTITIASPADGQHFVLGSTISSSYSCDDPGGSGVATCTAATPINTAVGAHTYTVNATDNVGNAASKSITYTVDPDLTAPTITISLPTEGQHFALNAQINASYTCADQGGSGLATCAASGPVSTNTPGPHTFTVIATDNAGNQASKLVNYVVDPDVTPPTITITSPVEGQHFALGAQINTAYSCDDVGGSGVATCVAAGPAATTAGAHTFTVNATDNAGNPASKTVNYVVDPDVTPPTITIAVPADNQHYALGEAIAASYSCADTGGSGLATCVATGPIDYTAGTHAYVVNATDGAGNPATKTVHYTIDPDVTPPTISITSPVDGQHYAAGSVFPGTFTCADAGGSGVAVCAAITGVDYSTGTHVFTVRATDRADNVTTKSVTYVVDAPAGGGGETPAPVTPAPITPAPGTPTGSTPTGSTPTGNTPPSSSNLNATPRVTVASRASTTALFRGVSVSISGLKARTVATLQIRRGLRTIKTIRARANAAGKATFKIRLSRVQLRTLRGKTLTLRFSTTAASGKAKVVTKRLRVL